jgi:hypothetical protein
VKIWRYVDLAKFMSILATKALYFPCATTELKDPYEGWLPRSHMKAIMGIHSAVLDQMRNTQNSFLDQNPTRDRAPFDALLEDTESKLNLQQLLRETNSKFGVSCWHINEDE